MKTIITAGLFVLLAAATSAQTQPPSPTPPSGVEPNAARGEQLAKAGNPQGGLACAQCHGPGGTPDPSGTFPRVAGQPAYYLYKELNDFASGARQNPIMTPIAKALSDQERQDVSVYYAGLDLPYPAPASVDAQTLALGRTLVTKGSPERDVQACDNCHGPASTGLPPDYPQLAGQFGAYTRAQMQAFRNGDRHNDVAGVMRGIAKKLSEQEIGAVASYLESVRPQASPGQ